MTVIVSLILLVAVVMLGFIARLAADVRAIREESLADIRTELARRSLVSASGGTGLPFLEHPGHRRTSGGCFIIWEWRGGDWVVRSLPAGIEPGLPPRYPGAFEGDLAKTWIPL